MDSFRVIFQDNFKTSIFQMTLQWMFPSHWAVPYTFFGSLTLSLITLEND